METKIFLEGFNSKKSVNTDEGLNVDLKGKRRLLPTNDVAEVISQFDQYQEEREKCNIIRLTCQVNPICSNVLFNRISEIVKDEGSPNVSYINYGVIEGVNSASKKVDYGTDEEKLKYKKREVSFWNSGSFKYQNKDNAISVLGADDKLYPSITSNTEHYANGSITSDSLHPTNSIRDMQLSYCGYVYHCGLDILNNHLIRSKTFKCVCKMPERYSQEYDAFNTIADLMRDIDGYKVVEKIIYPKEANVRNNLKFIAMHLYKYDDVYTFSECYEKRLIDTFNGWVGFDNKPKIKTYEVFSIDHMKVQTNGETEKELHIERPIMYMNGGDFVDMYPDRTLYSFVPKFNHFRNRIEKNWNYCLTYPSSSTTSGFEDIIETSNSSLKAIYFNENTIADNGITQLVIYSIAKHGLSVGDTVNIYKTYIKDGKTVTEKIIDNAEVKELADEYIFTVFNADTQISKEWVEITRDDFRNGSVTINSVTYTISSDRKSCTTTDGTNVKTYYIINGRYVNIDDSAQHISYKKVVNDIECEYYVRIFSKIPNFKNASEDTSNEYQIYKNDAEVLHTYQDKEYDFESHVSRLAFAKNIYTDEVGEVVFTDDINIANLKDNLGRPLSSIYLTLIKNNKGYKEWYGYDYKTDWDVKEITADTVEYSHCFGKITCGIETSDESTCNGDINSIYTISNDQNESGNFGYDIENINGASRSYNNCKIAVNEIWFDLDKHYYGDLCYYDNYNAVERSIQPIMHRFNTAQRECSQTASANKRYYTEFVYDEIGSDDYDASGDFTISATTVRNTNRYNEGYYYNPHYEIRIRTFDKIQTVFPDFLTIKSLYKISDNTYRITCLQNHYLTLGDKSIIYDKDKRQYYYCTTVSDKENDTYRTFTCKIYDEKGNMVDIEPMYGGDENLKNYRLFKMDNLDIPSYATVLKDGSCRVIYRNILNNGFNMSDDTVEEYPFTNGAFYVNKRIDLFVRRQDPHGWYGLRKDDLKGKKIEKENDNYVKDKDIVC